MRPAKIGPILCVWRASTVPMPNSAGDTASEVTEVTVTATGASGPDLSPT